MYLVHITPVKGRRTSHRFPLKADAVKRAKRAIKAGHAVRMVYAIHKVLLDTEYGPKAF